jgi:CRP-like cAMP-binding protein
MIEIKKHFQKMGGLSEKDWEFIASKLVKRTFSKKSIIVNVGEKEHYLSFIKKGIVRTYIPRDLDDITMEFAFEGKFVSAYMFFLTQQPSKYQLEALTDTILWSVSYDDLQKIYKETEMGNVLGRLTIENLFLKKSIRNLALLTLSAEDRYLDLFEEQPEILQLIPLKYIASYIGITPQALSRIRKRIAKKTGDY